MGHGGGGKDGIAVVVSRAGLAQAESQVFDQHRKMSRAVLIAERNAVEFTALFRPRQPTSDDIGSRTQQYYTHTFLVQPPNRFAIHHSFSDEVGEPPNLEWLHHNF